MKSILLRSCSLLGLMSVLLGVARANTTVDQPNSNNFYQVQYFAPIGQTFTAADTSLVGASLWFQAANLDWPNTPLTLSLYKGDGVGGALLDTQLFSMPSLYIGYHDFVFSDVHLDLGQTYSLAVTADSPYFMIGAYMTNQYDGGRAFGTHLEEPLFGVHDGDLKFRLEFAPSGDAKVPEASSSLLLLSAACAGFLALRRRR